LALITLFFLGFFEKNVLSKQIEKKEEGGEG